MKFKNILNELSLSKEDVEKFDYFVYSKNETCVPSQMTFWKKSKGFFGPVFKEIQAIDFFTLSRKNLEEKNKYLLGPSVIGVEFTNMLKSKAIFNLSHKISDFGCRTSWRFTKAEMDIKKEDETSISGTLNCDFEIFGPNMKSLAKVKGIEFSFSECDKDFDVKEYLRVLFQNSCNGVYQTARDFEKLYKILGTFVIEKKDNLFYSLDDYYNYLIENKIMTSLFTSLFNEYPNDKELQQVKNLIKNQISLEEEK